MINSLPFFLWVKSGNISRKFLTFILKIFDKNFERLHYALERQKIRCGESFRLLGFPVAEGKGHFRASLVDAIGITAGSGKLEKILARKFSPRNFPRNSRQEMQEKLYTFQKNCYNEFIS